MFTEMRAALGIERALSLNDLQKPKRPPSITARDVLGFATREGARAVGLEHRVGTLSPGRSADLILIPRHALNLAPMADPIAALVLGGHAGNVEAVFVEGRAVKWAGAIIDCDPKRAIALLERTREHLCAKAS